MTTAKSELLLDTGPLVATLNRRDRHHRWAKTALAQATSPVWTVGSVVAETVHLIRRSGLDPAPLFDLLERGALGIDRLEGVETEALTLACRKYRDVAMSWADAELLALCEKRASATLLTFDSDFRIYRRFKSEPVRLLEPR